VLGLWTDEEVREEANTQAEVSSLPRVVPAGSAASTRPALLLEGRLPAGSDGQELAALVCQAGEPGALSGAGERGADAALASGASEVLGTGTKELGCVTKREISATA